ncbi:MAG: Uma2 family endonuclease [Cyanobacteria bacterium P01_H01_bin.121]
MTASPTQVLTLTEFLQLPQIEESPAWEYVAGQAYQKSMPKLRHSLLQKKLVAAVDQGSDTHTALPELRCTVGGRSIAPDVAVVAWAQITTNTLGEPEDNFTAAPAWTIEIVSPGQQANRVIDNILHCLAFGCELGWLVDPDDRSIAVFRPQQQLEVVRGDRELLTLLGVNLTLTVAQIFAWLKIIKPE